MPEPSDEIAQLRARIGELEARVGALESSRPVVTPARPKRSLLTAATVNRAGALTLALGILFVLKYAADNAWVGARERVVAGIASGVLLIGAAEWLNRKEQRLFAQGIAGCGIAALYISCYAAFGWYNVISEPAAFAFLVIVSSAACWLSLRFSSLAIAVLAFAGALATPLLLRTSRAPIAPDAAYLLLLDCTAIFIAARRRWTELAGFTGLASLLLASFLFDAPYSAGFMFFAAALWAANGFACSRQPEGSALRNALYFVSAGCFLAAALRPLRLIVDSVTAPPDRSSAMGEAVSLFLAACGMGALLYSVVRASAVNRSLSFLLLGAVILKLYVWDVWYFGRFYRTTAFVSLGILLLTASWIYSRTRSRPEGNANAISASPPGDPQ